MSEKICVLGVAGGSASGKTTIIKKLQDYFGKDIAVIMPIIRLILKCHLKSAAN